jgi:hypothetical protein
MSKVQKFARIKDLGSRHMGYDDPETVNQVRADWGEAGILAADPDWGGNEVYTSVKDAVTNLCHAIARMGLDPWKMLAAGHDGFEADNTSDIGGGTPVEHDTERFPNPMEELPTNG